jgi:hypothetical protein
LVPELDVIEVAEHRLRRGRCHRLRMVRALPCAALILMAAEAGLLST